MTVGYDIVDLLSPVCESREVDVDDLRRQVSDIDMSLEDLRGYRDNCPRGSSRRADFAASINRLASWQKRLRAKIDKAVAASKGDGKKRRVSEALVVEGGLGGHLMHLYDNRDLTFGEIKQVFSHAAEGKLERVTEKTDGQNIFVSWNVSSGKLLAARNKGNIKTGGLDAEGLASKFAGRGTVYDAFVNGFDVISRAVAALSPEEKVEIFGPNADVWYSVEVMFTANPNIVNYDKNNIVFHEEASARYDKETGNPTDEDISEKFHKLVAAVDRMNSSVGDAEWNVMGPPVRTLTAMASGKPAADASSRLDAALSSVGLSDSATVGEYIDKRVRANVSSAGVPDSIEDGIVARVMGVKGAPTAAQLSAGLDAKGKSVVASIVKSAGDIMKDAIAPIEDIVHDFAVEVLRGMESVFVVKGGDEVERVRGQVRTAIDALTSTGDEQAMSVLNAQLKKLKGIENISTPAEGIVFWFNGNAYKFTGNFAPVNQILGLFKYGRNGSMPVGQKESKTRVTSTNGWYDDARRTRHMDMVDMLRETLVEKKAVTDQQGGVSKKGLNPSPKPFPPAAMVWTSWDKKNPRKFEPVDAGVGPGEDRLAWEFNAEVQGGNTSYDLVVDGARLEVKAPDKEKTIRPGTKGLRAISDIKYELDSALRQLKAAMKKYREVQDKLEMNHSEREALEDVMAFVVNDIDGILGGELSKDKIIRDEKAIKAHKSLALWDVMHIMHDVINNNPNPMTSREIDVGGKKRTVDMGTYARLAAQLGMSDEEADITPYDVLMGMLTHKAFTDPKGFMRDFYVAIDPAVVFAGTDGMFLVNSSSYLYVPAASYNEVLKFVRITQGKPKFKVAV